MTRKERRAQALEQRRAAYKQLKAAERAQELRDNPELEYACAVANTMFEHAMKPIGAAIATVAPPEEP